MRLICSALAALIPAALAGQNVPELTPAVARLLKTYEKAPDGTAFFEVHRAAVELKGTGLWVRYGESGDPPIRIDRATSAAKTIGAKGKGPNEFAQPTDLVPSADGLIIVRDPARQSLFWVDKDGVQRRTWSVPTGSNMQGKTFTDAKGHVFIGVSSFVNGSSIFTRPKSRITLVQNRA